MMNLPVLTFPTFGQYSLCKVVDPQRIHIKGVILA